MHFTVAGLFALAMAVAATPVAIRVSNDRRSITTQSEQLWHATPEKGVNINELQQKCGNLIVSCCNQANKNENENELAGLPALTSLVLAGVLPGNQNSACTVVSPSVLGTAGQLLTGLPPAAQNFCTGATYACCPGKGGECNAISVASTSSDDSD